MVNVVKNAIKTQNINHVIFPGLSMESNLQKRIRKKGLTYTTHPKIKNIRANSYPSDMI
mgnify:CR=1 FL=1